ncbi:MAG: hypothetical protein ACO1RX_19995 [Candidatus Sericytochromatia bacterium]
MSIELFLLILLLLLGWTYRPKPQHDLALPGGGQLSPNLLWELKRLQCQIENTIAQGVRHG